MADIGIGSVVKIIEVGLAINEAVKTVQQNKEDCHEIQKHALRITAILKRLEETKMMDDPATRDALEDLEESLWNALTLVTACQESHIVCLFCKARDLSKKLRRVQDDIERRVMLGVFAANIHVTIILTNIEGASSSDTTDDSRIETDIKDNTVIQAECDTPFASLHGLRKFSLAEVENATNFFSKSNFIGQGGFGNLYKGALEDKQVVAIKVFKSSHGLSSDKEVARELDIISKVEHRNIVKCLGYVHEVQGRIVKMGNEMIHAKQTHFSLVQEYMSNGDMERINCGSRANWSSRLQLIYGIAQGLSYLQGQRIIHMDLKPSNILLDSDMNAKITDFGISRMFDDSTIDEITTNLTGTMGYMPPEYVMSGAVTFKTNVYAFGIILLGTIIGGMCKGDQPRGLASIEWAREARDKSNEQLRELFDPSLFDESQLKQMNTCLDIGLRCVERNRHKRPSMADIVAELDRIKDAETLKNPSLLHRLNTPDSEIRRKAQAVVDPETGCAPG